MQYFLTLHRLSNNNSSLNTLWSDEIFGRHALLSRGWRAQDKRKIMD